MGVRVAEEDGVIAEGVEGGSGDAGVAVGREVVGAEGIDGDEDDRRAGGRFVARAGGEQDEQRENALQSKC